PPGAGSTAGRVVRKAVACRPCRPSLGSSSARYKGRKGCDRERLRSCPASVAEGRADGRPGAPDVSRVAPPGRTAGAAVAPDRAEPAGIGSAGARDPQAREVRLLGALLGQVIIEQAGVATYDTVERIRR